MVNDKIADERIKGRFQRPEIQSAVVAPIRTEGKLLGVMNIGTRYAPNKFDLKNVEVLRQLVKLTAVSFQDIPAA